MCVTLNNIVFIYIIIKESKGEISRELDGEKKRDNNIFTKKLIMR